MKCWDSHLNAPGNPHKGREAAASSFIKEIQEVQGGQEVPHNDGATIPKDA
jgi:hypothetical protein